MPVYSPSHLERLAAGIFRGVGAPDDIASHVAHSLVVSNLMGHDSHGMLRVTSYLEAIEKGGCDPTTDAEDFYAGGMLLPFGCHKGYGLSVVVDLLGRHLAGAEEFVGDGNVSFGNLIIVLNANSFRPLAEFQQVARERLGEIKGVKTAPGFSEIMLPGEPERHTLAQRMEEGINLPEETMNKLAELAARYGVSMPEVAAV